MGRGCPEGREQKAACRGRNENSSMGLQADDDESKGDGG